MEENSSVNQATWAPVLRRWNGSALPSIRFSPATLTSE